MRKSLYSALSWTFGMFALLAGLYSFTQGFGGLIASSFFIFAAAGILPATNIWVKEKLSSIYRKPVKQNALVTFSTFLLVLGILASPVENNSNVDEQVFAGENRESVVEEMNNQEPFEEDENDSEKSKTSPLINRIIQDTTRDIKEFLD